MTQSLAALAPQNLKVGSTFNRHDSRPYTIDGVRHFHEVTTANKVTKVDGTGFEYVTTEVLAEANRPSFAGTPSGGSMTWLGLQAAIGRGEDRRDEGRTEPAGLLG